MRLDERTGRQRSLPNPSWFSPRLGVRAAVGLVFFVGVVSPLAGSLKHTPQDKIGISYGGAPSRVRTSSGS